MVTREEYSKKIKRRRFITRVIAVLGISISLTLLIGDYLDSQNDDIRIVEQWYECKINVCEYRLTVENSTKLRKSAFVRVTAYIRQVHPDGGDTFPVVNSKRFEIHLKQGQELELTGEIKFPLKASFLKFSAGAI
jgi:hypothetical protein